MATDASPRRALVTGSSRGLGRAIALELAAGGFAVTVHCRRSVGAAEELVGLIRGTGGAASLLAFDVADRAACRAALDHDLAEHGPYYGVVLSAGITRDKPFVGLTDDDWDDVLRTNLDGFYNVLRPLVMPMLQARRGGRIVTLSSVAGLMGNRGQVNYSASKAGIIGATRSLARELAKRRITVNCVAPGLIESEMTAQLDLREILKHVPLGRIGTADEVAAAVGYLFSERAAYVTGHVLSVNGGMV